MGVSMQPGRGTVTQPMAPMTSLLLLSLVGTITWQSDPHPLSTILEEMVQNSRMVTVQGLVSVQANKMQSEIQ